MKNYEPTFESILDSLSIGSMAPHDVSVYKYAEPYGRSKAPSDKYSARKAAQRAAYLKKKAIQEALSKGHKLCSKCEQELQLTMFDVDKKSFTGYSSWCKGCRKEYNKRYQKNYSDNIEGINNDQANGE